jgi:hypothetical protein
MDRLVVMGRDGREIRSVDEWFEIAPPVRGAYQWKDGFSAKELAKAWFRSPGVATVPSELTVLLETNPTTQGATITLGIAEYPTGFDSFPGGKRHHDLLAIARKDSAQIVIGIEAKAAEPLGSPVIEMYEAARTSQARGTSTNLPARIDQLLQNLFGRTLDQDVGLGSLFYQLLTAAAGTLVEAKRRGATAAALVVHELKPSRGPELMSATQSAVAGFISALDGSHPARPTVGVLHGPLTVPGGGLIPGGLPFFVGVARE